MSEKLFGRVYESVGSSSSDLLIKSKGSVKIQWGNKYIDLIKNGEINYPKDKIQKLIISLIEQNTEEIFKSLEELKVLNESFEEIKKTLQDLNIINPSTSNGSNILTQLDNRITEEIDRAIQAEGFINTAIVNETDRASQQEKSITDNLNKEIERSTNKDIEFEESIQLISASSGLDEYGNYIIASESNYIAEATSIHNSIVKLDTSLKTEVTTLNEAILFEKERAEGIETGLQSSIDNINNTTIPNLQAEIDSDVAVEKKRAEEIELDLYKRIAPIETNVSNLEQNVVPVGGVILFDKTKTLPESWVRLTTEEYDVQIGDLSYVYIVKE